MSSSQQRPALADPDAVVAAGGRRPYREIEWLRDKKGRWVAFIGFTSVADQWDGATPRFSYGRISNSAVLGDSDAVNLERDAVARPVERLDEREDNPTVLMEVGRDLRDLGRVEAPARELWDSLPQGVASLPTDGSTVWLRRPMSTFEGVSNPVDETRARLQEQQREARAALGEGPLPPPPSGTTPGGADWDALVAARNGLKGIRNDLSLPDGDPQGYREFLKTALNDITDMLVGDIDADSEREFLAVIAEAMNEMADEVGQRYPDVDAGLLDRMRDVGSRIRGAMPAPAVEAEPEPSPAVVVAPSLTHGVPWDSLFPGYAEAGWEQRPDDFLRQQDGPWSLMRGEPGSSMMPDGMVVLYNEDTDQTVYLQVGEPGGSIADEVAAAVTPAVPQGPPSYPPELAEAIRAAYPSLGQRVDEWLAGDIADDDLADDIQGKAKNELWSNGMEFPGAWERYVEGFDLAAALRGWDRYADRAAAAGFTPERAKDLLVAGNRADPWLWNPTVTAFLNDLQDGDFQAALGQIPMIRESFGEGLASGVSDNVAAFLAMLPEPAAPAAPTALQELREAMGAVFYAEADRFDAFGRFQDALDAGDMEAAREISGELTDEMSWVYMELSPQGKAFYDLLSTAEARGAFLEPTPTPTPTPTGGLTDLRAAIEAARSDLAEFNAFSDFDAALSAGNLVEAGERGRELLDAFVWVDLTPELQRVNDLLDEALESGAFSGEGAAPTPTPTPTEPTIDVSDLEDLDDVLARVPQVAAAAVQAAEVEEQWAGPLLTNIEYAAQTYGSARADGDWSLAAASLSNLIADLGMLAGSDADSEAIVERLRADLPEVVGQAGPYLAQLAPGMEDWSRDPSTGALVSPDGKWRLKEGPSIFDQNLNLSPTDNPGYNVVLSRQSVFDGTLAEKIDEERASYGGGSVAEAVEPAAAGGPSVPAGLDPALAERLREAFPDLSEALANYDFTDAAQRALFANARKKENANNLVNVMTFDGPDAVDFDLFVDRFDVASEVADQPDFDEAAARHGLTRYDIESLLYAVHDVLRYSGPASVEHDDAQKMRDWLAVGDFDRALFVAGQSLRDSLSGYESDNAARFLEVFNEAFAKAEAALYSSSEELPEEVLGPIPDWEQALLSPEPAGAPNIPEPVSAISSDDREVFDTAVVNAMVRLSDAGDVGAAGGTGGIQRLWDALDRIETIVGGTEVVDAERLVQLRADASEAFDALIDGVNDGSIGPALQAGLGVDLYGAWQRLQGLQDFTDVLEGDAEAAGPSNTDIPEVVAAFDALDGVTGDDGALVEGSDANTLTDAAVALGDAAVAVDRDGDGTPAAQDLADSLEDTAEVVDQAADVVVALNPQQPAPLPFPSEFPSFEASALTPELLREYGGGEGAWQRLEDARAAYNAAATAGEQDAAATAARQMQQAVSDIAAELMDRGTFESEAEARRLRAYNRRIGSALRKAGYPRTRIDRRNQPKARARRAAALQRREERREAARQRRAARRSVRARRVEQGAPLGAADEELIRLYGAEQIAGLPLERLRALQSAVDAFHSAGVPSGLWRGLTDEQRREVLEGGLSPADAEQRYGSPAEQVAQPGAEDLVGLLESAVDATTGIAGGEQVADAYAVYQAAEDRGAALADLVVALRNVQGTDAERREFGSLADRIEAASRGAGPAPSRPEPAVPVSSTDNPTVESVVEAVRRSAVSDTAARRTETALSPADVAEAVQSDPAAVSAVDALRDGRDADPVVLDAVAQSAQIQEVGAPSSPPSATAAESQVSALHVEQARQWESMPQDQLVRDVLALMDGSNFTLQRMRQWLDAPQGTPQNPKPSRRELLLMMHDSGLTKKQRKRIANRLLWLDRDLMEESARNPSAEGRAFFGLLSRMTSVMLDKYLRDHDLTLSDYTANQHDAAARLRRIEQAMATPEPPAGSWMYMDDYNDDVDYTAVRGNLDAALARLGGAVDPDRFATDSTEQALLDQARFDLARLIDGPLAGPDFQREVVFERIINKLNRVAGDDPGSPAAQARDLLIDARRMGRSNPPSQWDVPDAVLHGVRDALLPFIGKGSDNGRALLMAFKALDDARDADAGSNARWAALMRARNQLELVHGEPLVPLMHALNVRVDPQRLRRLDDPMFRLAPDNQAPARTAPRGSAWTSEELGRVLDMAVGLRQSAEGLTGTNADLRRTAAKTLERAVGAYRAGRYGEFELFSSMALSRLMQVGDTTLVERFARWRDGHWGESDADWAAKIDRLRAGILQYAGVLPTSQQIDPRDGDRALVLHQLQNARAAIVEAISNRPDGSIEQRALLDRALWELRQADDPRTYWLQQLLLPWDPNGDVREMGPAPGDVNDGGSVPLPAGLSDARVARAAQVVELVRASGGASRERLMRDAGLSASRVDDLLDPLVTAGVLTPPSGDADWYSLGDAVVVDGDALPSAEMRDLVIRAMTADRVSEPVSGPVREDPVERAWMEDRALVRSDGSIVLRNPDGSVFSDADGAPAVSAVWDEGRGAWVLSSSGGQQEFTDLGALEIALSLEADRAGLPRRGSGGGDDLDGLLQSAADMTGSIAGGDDVLAALNAYRAAGSDAQGRAAALDGFLVSLRNVQGTDEENREFAELADRIEAARAAAVPAESGGGEGSAVEEGAAAAEGPAGGAGAAGSLQQRVQGIADRALEQFGDTEVFDMLRGAAAALGADGQAESARDQLDVAAAAVLRNAGVLRDSDTAEFDGSQVLAAGALYADIRGALADVVVEPDLGPVINLVQGMRSAAPAQLAQGIDEFLALLNAGDTDGAHLYLDGVDLTGLDGVTRAAVQQIRDVLSLAAERPSATDPLVQRIVDADRARVAGLPALLGGDGERGELLGAALRLYDAGDYTGAYFAARQASLDVLTGEPGAVPGELMDTLRRLSAHAVMGSPQFQVPDSLRVPYEVVHTFSYERGSLDDQYAAAEDLADRLSTAATNASFSQADRQEFARRLAQVSDRLSAISRTLNAARPYRSSDGSLIRRPSAYSSGTVMASGRVLVPGDMVERTWGSDTGRPLVVQSATLAPDSAHVDVALVDPFTGEVSTARGVSGGYLPSYAFISSSPSVAVPARQWGPVGAGTPDAARVAHIQDRYGREFARTAERVAGESWSLDQVLDGSVPQAVREQALIDLFTGPLQGISDIRNIDLDVSSPDRVVVAGELATSGAGAAETFRVEFSRADATAPPVVQVQFGSLTASAARAKAQAEFRSRLEPWAVGNGAASVQWVLHSKGSRVDAAAAGYDWDVTAMGGLDEVRGTVLKMVKRAVKATDPANTDVLARLGQMREDALAAQSIDTMPVPFELLYVDPSNPKAGQSAVGGVPWTGVRFLDGPAGSLQRSARIERLLSEGPPKDFSVWGADRVAALERAYAELPSPEQIGGSARRFGAVLNTMNVGLEKGQPALVLRVTDGSLRRGASPRTAHGNVEFAVDELAAEDLRRVARPLGDTGLTITWENTLKVMQTLQGYQQAKKQQLPGFETGPAADESLGKDTGTGEYVPLLRSLPTWFRYEDGSVPTMEELEAAFGSMRQLRNMVAASRQETNRETMARVFDVNGASMTFPQMLQVTDALWRGQDTTMTDVRNALRDAGVDDGMIAAATSGTARNFMDALDSAVSSNRGNVLAPMRKSGPYNGYFGFSGSTMKAHYMTLPLYAQGGGMAGLLQQRLGMWAIAHDVVQEITVQANIDVGNYAWALAGFDFDGTPSERKAAANKMLGWIRKVAATDAERAAVEEWQQKINSGDPSSEDFPKPFELVTIGMYEAVAEGRKDWAGKKGMIGSGKFWYGRLKLRPDRLYNLVYELERSRRQYEEWLRRQQSNSGGPGTDTAGEAAASPVEGASEGVGAGAGGGAV